MLVRYEVRKGYFQGSYTTIRVTIYRAERLLLSHIRLWGFRVEATSGTTQARGVRLVSGYWVGLCVNIGP